MDTIGKRIKYVREVLFHKISQSELGKRISVSGAQVSKCEHDKINPSPQFIQNFCTQLGINETWLRTGIGTPTAQDIITDMEKLEAIMSGKSEVKKNFIRALADMPEALLDEMLPYLRKAVAEKEKL